MKIAKRLFAVVIAVLMIAAMVVPFAADTIPTGNNTLTVNGKDGFTASVYKIADFNTTTGAFSNAKSTDVLNALKAGDNAALLNEANDLTAAQLGSAADSFAFTSTATSHNFSLGAGVYYVKWTTVPSNVTKAQNSVVALPYFQNGAWVQTATVAGTKTSTGEISYDKIFTNAPSATSVNANIGDSIPFTITGSVPGSADSPAYELKFTDEMQYGLKLNGSVQIAVKGNGTQALTVSDDYTLTSPDARHFTITFNQDQLAALYADQITFIQIDYAATLTDDQVVIGGNGNPNTLTYTYKQSATSDYAPTDPITKIVKTYEFQVKKVDANDASVVLPNATFKLYKNTVADANLIATKTTGDSGIITFSGLADGTYKVVETAAPANYALNSKEFTVTIAADGTVSGAEVSNSVLTVPDPKVVLPNTGGTGTLLFTIGGIALIAGAAVLFVIYRKKSSSK